MDLFEKIQKKHFAGDIRTAFEMCKECAEHGNAKCMRFLAWYYYKGQAVEEDLNVAEHWFTKALLQGDLESSYGLGAVAYARADYTKAFKYFEDAYRHGFEPATYRLGLMYSHGLGVTKDHKKAYAYFVEGAKAGSVHSLRAKAALLMEGEKGILGRLLGAGLVPIAMIRGFLIALKDPADRRLSH